MNGDRTAELFREYPELERIACWMKRYFGVRGIDPGQLPFHDRLAIFVALLENDRLLPEESGE